MNAAATVTETTDLRLVEHRGRVWVAERTIRSGEVTARAVYRRDYPHQPAPDEVARHVFAAAFPTTRVDHKWWDR